MTALATSPVGGRVRPSEAQIAAALAILPLPVAGTSLGGGWQYANPAFCALLGYPLDELRALHREDVVHPEDRQRARAYERRLLDGDIASYHVAQRLVTRDGAVVWVWATAGMLREAHGGAATVLSSFSPMTGEEIAGSGESTGTQAGERTGRTHGLASDATSAGACVMAPGPEAAPPPLAPYSSPVPAEEPPSEESVAPARQPDPQSAEALLPDVPPADPSTRPPPARRPTPPYSAPVVPPSVLPPVGASTTPAALGDAASAAEPAPSSPSSAPPSSAPSATAHSDPARTRLLALLGHELRTPLNAIRGYAELLLQGARGPITEAQRGDLQRITQAERHLVRLANDVLALTSIESGRLTYRHGRVRAGRAFDEALALVTPQARAKGVRLHVEAVPPELTLRADGDKVRQVLVNLLSNAVKYTPTGGLVAVSAQREGGTVALLVRDTGRGIPADMRERVFEPFVRLPDIGSAEPAPQGVGLGLAISRGLARGMGGELTVESAVGAGSTFRFTVPGDE